MVEKSINIVVISQRPLDRRMMRDFCLDELTIRFSLQYWDVSKIIRDKSISSNTPNQVERSYARSIYSYKEFNTLLKKLPLDTIIIINTYKQYSTYRIHQIAGRYIQCAVLIDEKPSFACECENGHTLLHPNSIRLQKNVKRKRAKRIKEMLYQYETIIKTAKYIRYRGDFRFKQWRDAYYGQKCFRSYKNLFRIGMMPNRDYRVSSPELDTIRQLEQKCYNSSEEQKFIVFIDMYYPLHGDLKNRKPDFDWDALKEPYYDSLNRFFDKIEATYACPVIIAAHPNADYSQNPFNGREIQQFKSIELTKNAKAILLHASSIVSIIAYYDKPVCFISNNAFAAGNFDRCFYPIATRMATEFNLPLLNIDEMDNAENIFSHIPEDVRLRFLELYMGDTTSEKPYIEQLSDALIDIHNRINNN